MKDVGASKPEQDMKDVTSTGVKQTNIYLQGSAQEKRWGGGTDPGVMGAAHLPFKLCPDSQ